MRIGPLSRSLDPSAIIQGPTLDESSGFWHFDVRCQFLGGCNSVRVLLPDSWTTDVPHRVLYVLPVFPGIGGPWGDGLEHVRQLDIHNRHGLICVAPSFDTMPFYGAHATDPRIRHEAYVLNVLVPLIESHYITTGTAAGRLLFGFSKSGWGAFLLTLRHPDLFGYACSWDAPLMLTERDFGIWETRTHFGTRDQMGHYLPRNWARTNAECFRDDIRLVLMGRRLYRVPWFRDRQTRGFHKILRALGIAHHYDNDVTAPHTWNPGWMEPALRELLRVADAGRVD